jgi:predicted 2-oxoglutarate/Fe(II)-dependent dioxygenase YbiX
MGNLARHPAHRADALPLHAASPLCARYGMAYGDHLDDHGRGRREVSYSTDSMRLQSAPEATETAQVNAAYLNLIRMWSDL